MAALRGGNGLTFLFGLLVKPVLVVAAATMVVDLVCLLFEFWVGKLNGEVVGLAGLSVHDGPPCGLVKQTSVSVVEYSYSHSSWSSLPIDCSSSTGSALNSPSASGTGCSTGVAISAIGSAECEASRELRSQHLLLFSCVHKG